MGRSAELLEVRNVRRLVVLGTGQAYEALVEHMPEMPEAESLALANRRFGGHVGLRVAPKVPVDVDQGSEQSDGQATRR